MSRGPASPSEEDQARLAVALRYQAPSAPVVVAKGRGFVAEDIIAKAREANVAIEENPALAGALATLELDTEIPEELYLAVAEVIALVMRAARKA